MNKNKIFKLIETIVERKDLPFQLKLETKILSLYPIECDYVGYIHPHSVMFSPHEDYGKKSEIIEEDLNDDSIRWSVLTKLNSKIDEYNKWVDEQNVLHEKEVKSLNLKPNIVHSIADYNLKTKQYWRLEHFPMWSFTALRKLPDKKTYEDIISASFYINDEELFKLNRDDPDFPVRINKTIDKYIQDELTQSIDKHIKPEDSIWYKPAKRFQNWISKHPSDAKPYPFDSKKINWTDPLWKLALKFRKRKDAGDFKTYMDAYRYAVKQYNHYGEPVDSPQKLVKAFENASGQMPKEIVDYLDG